MMLGTRERRIEIVKRRLLRGSMPRIQISVILAFTGLAGFLTSFSLLRFGVSSMWMRYPVAIIVAYSVFLLLLRLWLWLQRHSIDFDLDLTDGDVVDAFHGFPIETGKDVGNEAGGSWAESISSSPPSNGSSLVDGVDFGLDLEEGWLVVLAVVLLSGGLIASFYVIYIAPALLAEILVDGALLAGLYKRVKKIEERHWLRSALHRTLLPAFLAATFFTIAGFLMQRAVPTAHTIGDVWRHIAGN